ncbi:MAG TPA: tRNA (adenosine(37)-N6)-threonylcarbamoyltransferase complex transferase subunit TsaD [Pirellulaceae bacterium]|nr:tRNA (adenosine(37)-N6)-threonylcarbamoyltransferase complex transferase subunit TsaD [Pirellulaceae bacterium]
MILLTIETTCDETAAAVVTEELAVLSSVVASQDELHRRFAGVVPEIAARAHVERILPVIDEALRRAGVALGDLDAIAVANTPGLAGSLLVGLVAAKTLCVAADKPLVAINHLHAHIYACRMAAGREVFPCLGLIVSGGHTSLYHCAGPVDFEYLGGTIDDAAGEAFDKVAAMLGLAYPGGPSISRAAESGNPRAYHFPRGLAGDKRRLDFSFSGLKTAVRYAIAGPGNPDISQARLTPQDIADLAASFQAAVVESLVEKTLLALARMQLETLCVGGGVAANRLLRERLADAARERGFELHIAPPELCTDNAVMGAIAFERLKAGHTEPLDLDVIPGLVRR